MSKLQYVLDKIGICTSVVCLLHCLSIPVFLLFGMDVVLRSINQEWVEWTIIGLALVIGIVSFLGGFITHRQHYVPVLYVAGFLLLVNGEAVVTTWVSLTLTIAGSMVIAYAHVQNLKWKRYVVAP